MSRDKLFPKVFGEVHPKYHTPHISTWVAGFAVAIPSGIWGIADAADLTNIGTLFAFILVSAAVIVLRRTDPGAQARIPRALHARAPHRRDRRVFGPDVQLDADHLDPLRRVAGDWAGCVLLLQPSSQRVRGAR